MLHAIFIAFLIVFSIQLTYYLFIFGKFSFSKKTENNNQKPPISVIICTKNQEQNVLNYIPLLLNQNYPNFEIVLIDNASSDGTLDVFEEFEKNNSNIKLVKVENNEAFWGNKKFALTLGIKAAKNEYLLFTDPQCYPTSTEWIAEMSTHFSKEKTIILGYNSIIKIKNSFLNKLIRFENLLSSTQAFGWAKAGKPYTGNGKNLAYKREEFFKTNGFIEHMKTRTGEDALFINQAANSNNTTICTSKNSTILTNETPNFKQWIHTTRIVYNNHSKFKLFDKLQLKTFYTSQLLVIILPIILLANQYQWIIVASLLTTRYIITWITLGYSANKLNQKDLLVLYPIYEITTLLIQLNIFITNKITKPKDWK